MSNAAVIESQLLRWSDGPNGRTVTLLLPADTNEHPFRGLKCGPSNGQRLALSVALIADDETQKELEPAKVEGRSFAQRAGILCTEGAFHQFLSQKHLKTALQASLCSAKDVDVAAQALRDLCGVASRKDLVDGTPAGRRYLELEAEYSAWLRHG
jgi:hypothetical protein